MLDVEMEDGPLADKPGPSYPPASQINQLQLQVDQTLSSTTSDRQIYLALDTNILISNLELVKKLYARLKENPKLPASEATKTQAGLTDGSQADPLKGDVCLLMPYVVLDELDRLKMKHVQKGHASRSVKGSLLGGSGKQKLKGKSRSPPSASDDLKDSLALSMHNPSRKGSHHQADLNHCARDAITWLFETLKNEDAPRKKKKGKPEKALGSPIRRTIRFQKRDEKMGGGILELPSKADTQIMDCCRYFSSAFQGGHQVVLWTGDKHLRLQAEVHDVPTIGDGQQTFSRVLDHVVERLTTGREQSEAPATDMPPILGTSAASESIHQPKLQAGNMKKVKVKESTSIRQNRSTGLGQPKTDVASLPRTVRNIDNRLSEIIPLQLYSFLLERLFSSKPVELRAFLTTEDPGPGAWDMRHCLHLFKRAWSGLCSLLPQDRIVAISEAIIWLEGFLTWYLDPLRENVCPGGRSLSQTEQGEMYIDDTIVDSRDGDMIRKDWEQAKEAILLVFHPCLDESASSELEEVLRWMTSDETDGD